MCAAFHDASFVEHTYLVSILDSRQAVGNGYGGACAHQPFERLLHQSFAFGVERRGSLVKNKNVGVLEHGAGNRDALALSARQFAAAVAHLGVVALLALHYKVVRIGHLGSLHHLLHGGILHPEGNVVVEGVVKQNGLLVDIANELSQVRQGKRLDVDAVDGNFAPRHIVVAWQQVDQCRLARAALAHKGDGFAAAHLEVDPLQHGGGAVV